MRQSSNMLIVLKGRSRETEKGDRSLASVALESQDVLRFILFLCLDLTAHSAYKPAYRFVLCAARRDAACQKGGPHYFKRLA